MPTIAVRDIGAKGGNLDLEQFVGVPWAKHLDDAEAHADGDGAAKEVANLLRMSGGGDIVILGHEAKQFIADAAAGPQCLVAGVAQTANHVDGEIPLAQRRVHAATPQERKSPRITRMKRIKKEVFV